MSWLVYAFLSAFFAALTAILAKVGIQGIDSNLATAIRTIVVLVFIWGIVFFQGSLKDVGSISKPAWLFLILSGLATGLSWIFYFRALQMGEAAKVVPIDKLSLVLTIILAAVLLKEKVTMMMVIGAVLMSLGAIMIVG